MDAALGDEHFLGATAPGDALGQALGGAEIDGEVGQVAVVDADQPGVDGQRTVEFGLVVHLHQRGQAGAGGQAVQVGELGVVEAGGDEQDGVRAVLDCLRQLPLVDHEILAQQRQRDRLADGAQMVK